MRPTVAVEAIVSLFSVAMSQTTLAVIHLGDLKGGSSALTNDVKLKPGNGDLVPQPSRKFHELLHGIDRTATIFAIDSRCFTSS